MKYPVIPLLAACALPVVTSASATGPAVKTHFAGCTAEKTMYFAYTSDHAKAVEWCEVAGGYRYTYGPINHPETQMIKSHGEIGIINTPTGVGFAAKKGDIIYWTTIGHDGSDRLIVSQGNREKGKLLSIIYMESGMGYTNNASDRYKLFND